MGRGPALSLGRMFGVPVRLHWSWLLVFSLLAWVLSAYFSLALGGGRRFAPRPALQQELYWAIGLVTASLFCASLLAHELAHALMARRHGVPVRRITLFIFGGVAEIGGQPRTPGAEARMAAAGPLASLTLAALFWLITEQAALPRSVTLPAYWLARMNLLLGLFNLLPSFPMDGGRVFRALVWHVSGSARHGTRIAATLGRVIGFSFVAAGMLSFWWGGFATGLWQVLLGAYLQQTAQSQGALAELELAQADIRPA